MHDQIHRAHVDTEFERRGRYEHPHLAFFQFLFRRQAQLARETAVVRRDVLFANALAQLMRYALGHAPCVHKYQRCAMLLDQRYEPVVDLVPHFIRGDRTQRHLRNFYREIQLPLVSDVDDDRIRARFAGVRTAGEEMRYLFNRLLRS